MAKVHLWAPISTPLTPWVDIIQRGVEKFQRNYSTQTRPSDAHLRTTSFTRHHAERLLSRKDKKYEIHILVLTQQDVDGPERLEYVLQPLISAFNNSVTAQLLIFDLVKLGKDPCPAVVQLKGLLYSGDEDENLIIIGDFSMQNCFIEYSKEVCQKCLNKLELLLYFALRRVHFRRLAGIQQMSGKSLVIIEPEDREQ
jgi:hypothetical protein